MAIEPTTIPTSDYRFDKLCNLDRLTLEIAAQIPSPALSHLLQEDTILICVFVSVLDPLQETLLGTIVTNHDGTPSDPPKPITDDFAGDSGAGGKRGAVPAPAAGDAGSFLRGDGTWAAP
jgi:hypothetical protein